MNLKSFGCSFVYGSELSDASDDNLTYSRLTWPALCADKLGYTYQCYAMPGSGNLQILEKVLIQAARKNNDNLFVIGWTWIDRFDYRTAIKENPKLSTWATIRPVDETNTAQVYYRDLHSEYQDKLTSLSYIRLAIDTLQDKNIPYIMTYMDELLFDQQWHANSAIKDLQNYIKPHMMTFDNTTFLEWSRKNGYPETAAWHPLEAAHSAASDYIVSDESTQRRFDF